MMSAKYIHALIRGVVLHHPPLVVAGEVLRAEVAVGGAGEDALAVLAGVAAGGGAVDNGAVADHFVDLRPDRVDERALVVRGRVHVDENRRHVVRSGEADELTGEEPVRGPARRGGRAAVVAAGEAAVGA